MNGTCLSRKHGLLWRVGSNLFDQKTMILAVLAECTQSIPCGHGTGLIRPYYA